MAQAWIATYKAQQMMRDYEVTVVETDDNVIVKAQMEDHKVPAGFKRVEYPDHNPAMSVEFVYMSETNAHNKAMIERDGPSRTGTVVKMAKDVSPSHVKPAITGLCAVTPMGRT